jgi:hypothetical protein
MAIVNASNASEVLAPNNPANKDVEPKGNRRARVPMSVPVRKLETPAIEGYHTHWVKESNIPRALQAWYEFVEIDEVPLNQRNPGIDTAHSGSTDLGNRVSIAAGVGADGRPERQYLMKLKEEHWLEDREKIDGRNATVMEAIFRGEKIIDKDEVSNATKETRYVDKERTYYRPALFNRKRPKF